MLGNLYVVATPIGNLEDITLRAIRTLQEVDVVLAEDTRVTQKLLSFVSSHGPLSTEHSSLLLSYHQHSDERKKLEILKMLMDGKNLALVTDAGTPGISDPGNELIDFLLSHGPLSTEHGSLIKIIPIPGASAITTALSVSGLNASKFTFIGFLPKKKSKKLLEESLKLNIPVVFFESPYRIYKTISSLKKLIKVPSKLIVAQELTKLHEKYLRGNISEVLNLLEAEEKELGRVKGEIVVILEP